MSEEQAKPQRGDNRELPRVAPEDDEDLLRELEGGRSLDDQGTGVISADRVDDLGQISRTDIYEGELEAGSDADLPNDSESLEMLTELELRGDETSDAFEAAEEGEIYVPPIDPPTAPSDGPEGVQIAAGFGSSALDEPYDEDHQSSFLTSEDDVKARVRSALRADSTTTQYADGVTIIIRDNVVILRGMVDDLDDTDNLVAVASYVEGVDEVIDELEVRSLG